MEGKEPKMLKGRLCFEHLGGTLGNRLFARLIELGWFEPDEESSKGWHITETGKENLEKLGVDVYSKK